ncbi:flavin reductase family protein [uncultured Pseudoteredinibacter sp.]|uniref:flavin reductase family protein n=1 Tax=uncultured Pseudoteredinibacter sp. TaxID=1641701 RepID=UPI0026319B62|nr:flavin reductase family protein [uncultured Pseudoteredinibacter sp.]
MNCEQDLGAAMKAGMRRLASGVAVVTCRDQENGRQAMTASSVTSVSDSPASLLVCVNKATTMAASLKPGVQFAVNILSADQQDISNACAGGEQGEGRFAVGQWQENADQVPLLKGSQVSFSCKVDQVHSYGTHDIVIGQIESVCLDNEQFSPLIYGDGGYL